MPVVTVQMRKGRSKEAKKELLKQVSDAVASSIDVDVSRVRVLIHEVDDAHFSVGGVSYEDQAKETAHGT